VLLVAMLVSTLPQYALGVLAPVLTVDLSVGEAALGVVAALMYLFASAIARAAGGHLDVVGGRAAFGLLFSTAIGSMLLLSASRSLWWLGAAGAMSGVAMGINNPITNRLIAVFVAPSRRGLTIGVKQTGVKVAQLAAGVAIPWLAVVVGWRQGVALLAAAATGGLLVALAVVPPGRTARAGRAVGTPSDVVHQLRWLRRFAAFMAIGMSAITTYLPLYAVQRVGTTLTEAGLIVSTFALTATAARLFWAAVAGRLADPTAALLLLSGGGALGLAILAMAASMGSWALWVGAPVTGATAGSWNVVAQLTVVREVDVARAAAGTGVVQSAFLFGLAAGAPIFGVIVETMDSFTAAWGLAVLLALVAFGIARGERGRRATAQAS
jgi:MFS family permease